MRCIISLNDKAHPPILTLIIHNAPHRRMHQAVHREYRKSLWEAAKSAKIEKILDQIEMTVTFINPLSPDLDNLIVALFRALDGKTGKGPTILDDDRQIVYVKMGLMFL